MKNGTTLIALIVCIAITHAQRGKKVKGNGHVVTVERTTDTYDGISASGFYDIELIDGKEGQLTLKGEENILDNIETEVKRGTLVIRSKDNKHLIPSRGEGVFITVSVDEIDKIRLSGSGDFIGKKTLRTRDMDIQVSGAKHIDLTIDATDITIATSGSSNIDLKGNSEELTIRSSGSSNVKAYELEVDEATLELSGSSDVEVTVNESLMSRVSGSGNIQYRGNPDKVFNQISGSGSVSKN
ncbi:head GIN domain-containing protein [Ulvibacterium sp.]|uniref:head GIN domain-containing protein n=1 Tax=Ulvibacterium sp. TaxID=2665914 RepID=UPI003CC51FE7